MGRTNVVLDDRLVAQAMRTIGAKTKRAVIDRALRDLVERGRVYDKILALKGKLTDWEGDINAGRKSRY